LRDLEHVEFETLEWVDWFNHERPHESVDDLTPIQVAESPGRLGPMRPVTANPAIPSTRYRLILELTGRG
jgi:hypothetical protein